MSRDYLHNRPQFAELIRIVAEQKGIDPALVEKDYWIMHCLYGLQELGFTFALKGGTSLSKGHQIINRFSEDIDILIEPFPGQEVKTGKHQNSAAQIKTRKDFYDWLAQEIKIDGISSVERDAAFDDIPNYRGAGIRLNYDSVNRSIGRSPGGCSARSRLRHRGSQCTEGHQLLGLRICRPEGRHHR
jgi:Nucleotidyl transferase AbiEii toxin, Type IV TA system